MGSRSIIDKLPEVVRDPSISQAEATEDLAAKAAADTKRGSAITPERLREIIRDAYGLD